MTIPNSDLGGKSFYQSEPLIARLRGITRDYPEGIGILKELIQNADDAKATTVEITFDWRYHSVNHLPDERMSKLLGPAMLVYNDQIFTDRDFDSIRNLGQSQKAQDLQKTGRFGIGFNAIYHVTDYPSFISRQSLIFFDPHGTAIPGTSKQEPGCEWNLKECGWFSQYPEFMKIYEPGGLSSEDKDFQGTLFRLPLRTPEHAKTSEIRQQAFTETNVRELLEEFIQSSEELLLFLKSVQSLRVFEIPPNSNGKKQQILAIITKNPQDVTQARQQLLETLPDSPQSLIQKCQQNSNTLASISYRHEIETQSPQRQTQSIWRVVSLIRLDENNQLAEVVEALYKSQEKVLPWAGAAARISASSTEGNPPPVQGKIYCFLPLPLESGLPIHINGFFNLNSSRDNLSSDSGQTGKDRPRAIWNSLLTRHVVAHAWTNLITELVQDLGQYNPKNFYELWPTQPITTSKALEELHHWTIQLLFHRNVIRSAVKHSIPNNLQSHWITPANVKVLSGDWWKRLIEPLKADHIDIPDPPLPSNIVSTFKTAGCPLKPFTPEQLRKHLIQHQALGVPLKNAPKPSLRNSQWIIHLLNYTLSDNYHDLRGLPLALLANNTLQVFGYHPLGTIYIADPNIQRIFSGFPEWFLHSDLAERCSIRDQIGVTPMYSQEVAKNLIKITGSTPTGEINWQPKSPQPPNEDWLTLVFEYFTKQAQHSLPLTELNSTPLIPGKDNKLYSAKHYTLLLNNSQLDTEIIAAIEYFGVKLVQAQTHLKRAIEHFANRHPDQLILTLTGSTLVDTLDQQFKQGFPSYHEQHYTSLINFLSDHLRNGNSYDQDQIKKLRKFPIYLTNTNEIVSLNDDHVYLPSSGYNPPEIEIDFKFLRLGTADCKWLSLLQKLGVKTLNRVTLIRDCLLREYAALAPQEQLIALAWIREHLDKACQESEKESKALKAEIQTARLIRCTDGRLRSILSIYNPDHERIQKILGNKAAIPDMQCYSQDSALWLKFFESLEMRKILHSDDLLATVEALIQTANHNWSNEIVETALDLFDYLIEHWDLLKAHSTLIQFLREKAWLPGEQNLETIQQYPGAVLPQPKLYCTQDICFIEEAGLVASLRPIFSWNQGSIKPEIRRALNFRWVDIQQVLEHFENLVNAQLLTLETATGIYNYLYKNIVDNQDFSRSKHQEIKSRFEELSCLWDEVTQQFWKPIYSFTEDVVFFGSRRVKIPFSHQLGEVYQLLGQRHSPMVDDYLQFLQELFEEYQQNLLSTEDQNSVVQVLKRLEYQSILEVRVVNNLPLLTLEGQLRLATEIFIPDAHWRNDYVHKNLLLHPEISPRLAKASGSLSLLKELTESPVEVKPSGNVKRLEWCEHWQKTLNSDEFRVGLKRLIFHEQDIEAELTLQLSLIQVKLAKQIQVDLVSSSQQVLAEGVPGVSYFDEMEKAFYLISRSNRSLMLCYLVECLNTHLGEFALQNLLPLASILDAVPDEIEELLNELRIRSFAEKGVSSKPFQGLEKWVKVFYEALNYSQVSPLESEAENAFGCSQLYAIAKWVQVDHPMLQLSHSEWLSLKEQGDRAELLLILHNEQKVDKIIRVKNFWQTLRDAESQLKIEFAESNTLTFNGLPLVSHFSSSNLQRYVVLEPDSDQLQFVLDS